MRTRNRGHCRTRGCAGSGRSRTLCAARVAGQGPSMTHVTLGRSASGPARSLLLVAVLACVAFFLAPAPRRAVAAAGDPDLGPERLRVRPLDVDQRHPGDRRRGRRPAGEQPVRHRSATRCSSSPAPTGRRPSRSTSRSATTPRSPGWARDPGDVVINGSIDVYNQNGIALNNFWRSMSNLTINVTNPDAGCYTGEFWAVSQAAPMRRVHVNGHTTLMDYCTGPSFASGGFIADSQFTGGTVINGSQQQWYTRNSDARRLVERRVEPGVLRRHRCPRRVLRHAGVRRPTRRWPPPRSAARSPTSTSTAPAPGGSSCPAPATDSSGTDLGLRLDTPAGSRAALGLLRRAPGRLGQHDQQPARPRTATCC